MLSDTFLYKEIIKDKPTFDSFLINYHIQNVPSTDGIFENFLYDILYLNYSNKNIRYDEPTAFLNALALILRNKFDKYKKEKELIDSIYKLTLEDFEVINKTINNVANNPNTKPLDPTQPLDFVSSQNFIQIKDNKIKAYLLALNNLPTFNIYEFFNGKNSRYEMCINDLFMVVQIQNDYIYNKEK